jgi:hypothetical protein
MYEVDIDIKRRFQTDTKDNREYWIESVEDIVIL